MYSNDYNKNLNFDMFQWQMRDINKYLLAPIGENGRSVLGAGHRPTTSQSAQ